MTQSPTSIILFLTFVPSLHACFFKHSLSLIIGSLSLNLSLSSRSCPSLCHIFNMRVPTALRLHREENVPLWTKGVAEDHVRSAHFPCINQIMILVLLRERCFFERLLLYLFSLKRNQESERWYCSQHDLFLNNSFSCCDAFSCHVRSRSRHVFAVANWCKRGWGHGQ